MRRSKPYIEGLHDPMDNLTERQAEVVEFVRRWWVEHGYGPSMRDIADGLAISRGGAFKHVKALVERGFLRYEPRAHRSTRLAEMDKG